MEIFASSILGGLTSIFGAILGGLVIGGSEIVVGTDLTTGFGAVGAATLGVLLLLASIYLWREKKDRARILGIVGIVVSAYVLLEAASGLSLDPLVPGLVGGFGVEAIAYQKAVPLLIMVAALLVMPKGLVSINWKKLLRRARKK